MLIVTKPIRVVAFSKSHDPLIMWPGNFLFSLIRFVGLERKRICLIDSWKEASNRVSWKTFDYDVIFIRGHWGKNSGGSRFVAGFESAVAARISNCN